MTLAFYHIKWVAVNPGGHVNGFNKKPYFNGSNWVIRVNYLDTEWGGFSLGRYSLKPNESYNETIKEVNHGNN